MLNILIDTALFAVPNYAEDGSDADRLIDRVTHFAQLALPEIPISMVTMDEFEGVLWDNLIGPDFENIKDFLEMMELTDIYSAQDIFKQYNYLMQTTARASDCCCPLVTACSDVEVKPELPASLFPSSLRDETMKVLAQLCIQDTTNENWLYGSSLCSQKEMAFQVSALIEEAEPIGHDAVPTLPIKVDAEVKAFHCIQNLISIDTAERLWSKAIDAPELYLAVAIGALALRRTAGKGAELSDLKAFCIGSSFVDSLKVNQCFGEAKFSITTGRICMQIVADCFAGNIGELGKPVQLRRAADGGSAFRLHISSSGVALRLMFWKTGEVIEFANVGPKNELKIDDGQPNESFQISLADLF